MNENINERIKQLWSQAEEEIKAEYEDESRRNRRLYNEIFLPKFAELLIESVLDQVGKRAYYTAYRNWSDEMDRPWIQLEFGYGKLYDAKHFGLDK